MKLMLGFLSIIGATVCALLIPSFHVAAAISIPLSVLGLSLIVSSIHHE